MNKNIWLQEGIAINSKTGDTVSIFICAPPYPNIIAITKYHECIQRHPELIPLKNPQIGIYFGSENFSEFGGSLNKEFETTGVDEELKLYESAALI